MKQRSCSLRQHLPQIKRSQSKSNNKKTQTRWHQMNTSISTHTTECEIEWIPVKSKGVHWNDIKSKKFRWIWVKQNNNIELYQAKIRAKRNKHERSSKDKRSWVKSSETKLSLLSGSFCPTDLYFVSSVVATCSWQCMQLIFQSPVRYYLIVTIWLQSDAL